MQAGTMRPGWGDGAVGGSVLISNSTISNTWGSGLFITSKGSHAAAVKFAGVTFDTVQKESPADCRTFTSNPPLLVAYGYTLTECLWLLAAAPVGKNCPPPAGSYGVPIFIGGNSDSCFPTGGISFDDCTVIDPLNRTFILLQNAAGKCPATPSGQWALADIHGSFTVKNPFGCQHQSPANATAVDFAVNCVQT